MVQVGLDISAIDPQFKNHAARGIGRYVRELKRHFDAMPAGALSVGYFDHSDCRGEGVVDRLIDRLPAGRVIVRQQLVHPIRFRSEGLSRFDLLHFPAHMDAPSWGGRRCVVTVLDLIPLVCKELYTADNPWWRFRLARFIEMRAIREASIICAISECTARDVNRLLGVPAERIVVTPLGVDERFFHAHLTEPDSVVRARYRIPPGRPIVLYVGGIDPRKNYLSLVEVARALRERAEAERRVAPVFVLSGRVAEDREYPRLCEAIRSTRTEDDVVVAGFVPDSDLMQLFSISSCFFFPSLYEGFGLPPLEALAAGVPVVSSNTSAMPEVLGSAALMVDPLNTQALTEAVSAVMNDATLAARLRAAGPLQARRFPWSRTAELTLEAYRRALGMIAGVGPEAELRVAAP